MATLQVKGKLQTDYGTVVVSEKFKKREFVVELEEEINGNIYTNYAKMQLVQNKCDILDRFTPGDMICVDFNIKGNSYVDKKDGSTKYITNLDAWRISAEAQAYSAYAGQPNDGIPVHASNHTTNGGSGHAAAPAFNPNPEAIDDLPF